MYDNCDAGRTSFSPPPREVLLRGEVQYEVRRERKTAQGGQRPKLLKPALLKNPLTPYPAAVVALSCNLAFHLSSHTATLWVLSLIGAIKLHFCICFSSPLKKEGKCGKILLPWEPDFRLQGATFTQARCCAQTLQRPAVFLFTENSLPQSEPRLSVNRFWLFA